VLIDGVVYRNFVRPDATIRYTQLLVPPALRKELLLHLVHVDATGHMDVRKTQEQLQRRAYGTAWRTDAERFCKCCVPCSQYHQCSVPIQGLQQPMRVGWPSKRWQIELTGPHMPARGFKYMTAMDSFTKNVVAIPIRDKTAVTVARAFVDHVVLKCGAPSSILTAGLNSRMNCGQNFSGCWAFRG